MATRWKRDTDLRKGLGISVTLLKPITSGAKAEGWFGKQDFAYLPDENVYRCPAGQLLAAYRPIRLHTTETQS